MYKYKPQQKLYKRNQKKSIIELDIAFGGTEGNPLWKDVHALKI